MHMQKKISFGNLIFFSISCIVGAGIFLSSAKAYNIGSFHILWIVFITSLVATVMALCFAEMGGRFSKTGGVYLYTKESFGKGLAFNIGFIRFIVIALSLSTEGVALSTLLKDFNPIFGQPEWIMICGALFCFVIFVINYVGVSSTVFSTTVIEICVLGTLILFIVTGIFHIKFFNFTSTLMDQHGVIGAGSFTLHTFSNTFILLFYAFLGFENIGTGAQDIDNPQKNIPKVIKVTMIILSVLYFFIYFNLVGILGKDLIGISNGIGLAAASYFGNVAHVVVTVVCIIAMFGIGLTQMFSGARSLTPMAEDQFFPHIISRTNKNKVPVFALLTLTGISFLFIVFGSLFSKDVFGLLIASTAIGRFLQYIVVSLGILQLRKKKGDSSGYMLKYAKLLVPIVVFIDFFIIFTADKKAYYSMFCLIITAALVYFLYSKPREHRRIVKKEKIIS